MVTHSKRYTSATQAADLSKDYSLEEAVGVLLKLPKAKFDETVELSFRLGVDPKQGDQMVRATVALPHGSGKKVRVLAFTENIQAAKDAGAEYAGVKEFVAKIQEGWLDFDVAVATPDAMKEVRTLARILGPKGLMPNPKSGTVSDNLVQAVKEVKAGRVEFKMDKAANIGVGIGKRSFSKEQLLENATAMLNAVGKAKPAGCKGKYIHTVVLSSTMSPGVRLAPAEYSKF
jgi:large subunit ribosomal protein L1